MWPQWLPGGKAVLFTVWTGANFDEARIAVLSLAGGERRTLLHGGFYARYVPSGHLVFDRGGRLLPAPFDLERLEVIGDGLPVQDEVLSDASQGCAFFDVSQTGVLVFAEGGDQPPQRALVRVNRRGRTRLLTRENQPFSCPRVSPDGKRVALEIEGANISLWVYDLSRESLTRVSFGEDDHSVAWSPDGRRIVFESGRRPVHQIFVRRADGTGEDQSITSGNLEHYLCDWSADGRLIAYTEFHPETGADLWLVEPDGERAPRPFLRTRFFESEAVFSPDGRFIAYVSDESGRDEVYLRPLDGAGGRAQVSVDGGSEPAWARSGNELYYRSRGPMMAVPVRTVPEFAAGKPISLFEDLYHYNKMPSRTYDVTPDGSFVMVKANGAAPRQLHVATGWSEEVKLKAPPRGRE